MEKFVPYEKLSKKKQRERNKEKRGGWGALNPITRKSESSKAYNRKKARQWSCEDQHDVPVFLRRCRAADSPLSHTELHIKSICYPYLTLPICEHDGNNL